MDPNRRAFLNETKAQVKEFISLSRPLIRYARNYNNEKVGVMVAFVGELDKKLYMGWSRCNGLAGDKFQRDLGLSKAIRRADVVESIQDVWEHDPPWSMSDEYTYLFDRAARYFKQLDINVDGV